VILVDVNILMDVYYRREPHFSGSTLFVHHVATGRAPACLSAHGITTLYNLVSKFSSPKAGKSAVDWSLKHMEIATVGPEEITRARALDWPDFEDAVVAAAAESAGCTAIVTRNVRDFRGSPVPAMAPEELVIDEVHESFVAGYN